MSKKIIVTGGAGYIGDAVVQFLLQCNAEVLVVDNLMYGGSYMRQGIRFCNLDIRSHLLDDVILKYNPDAVIHLAAIVGDGACQVNPEETMSINENATRRIAELCALVDARLVFASTCSVYGSNNETLNEDSKTSPLSLYAGTKINAEKYVASLPNHITFRLGTLFGISSEHARIRCDLVANILTFRAMQGKPITVFGGDQWRPMLHVKDAALMFAQAALDMGRPGTYIVSKENVKIIDLARDISRQTGAKIIQTDAKFEDLRNYKVNTSKATSEGFIPKKSVADGILEIKKVLQEGRISNVWANPFHNARYVEAKYASN
jgi:nucleoside-diphosphate-sugar epimerase